MDKRGSGILLHISSLPSPHGIGDLGPGAYDFVEFLTQAKQLYWQILPLNPTSLICGNSPYTSISAFAGNTLFISPELLVKDGLLPEKAAGPRRSFPTQSCDYAAVIRYKEGLFDHAYKNFKKSKREKGGYEEFCLKTDWLEDYALFVALKRHFNKGTWSQWPEGLRDRKPKDLLEAKKRFKNDLDREKFLQYLFFEQWQSLKRYCTERGIRLIGDIPIYVSYDSADVWTYADIFKLDKGKRPSFVSGVPPDYFSKTGQLWGNPVYRWDILKERGYDWWMRRISHYLNLFDIIRIDHFRGLVAYWEVPAAEKTAVKGKWQKAPADDFLNTLLRHFPGFPIIAEDLGLITPDVIDVLERFKLPRMKVLLFAFGEKNPMHPYLPHAYEKGSIVYTGTHDNNTVKGWFKEEATAEDKRRLFNYLARRPPVNDLHWEFIRLAMTSVANTAIFPMQDVLGLDEKSRMNKPSTVKGNWQWRLLTKQLTPGLIKRLRKVTQVYGRAAA